MMEKDLILNSNSPFRLQSSNIFNKSNIYFSDSKKKIIELQKNETIKENYELNENNIRKISFSLIILFSFIIEFFFKNLK